MPTLYKSKEVWTGTLAAAIPDGTVTSFSLSSASGLTNGEKYLFTIDRVDASGTKTPSKKEVIAGTLSGTNVVSCTRGVEGTAQSHASGATVEVLFNSKHWEELIDYLNVEHTASGTHKTDLVTTLKATAAEVNAGTVDNKIATPKAIFDSNVVYTTKTQTLTNKTLTSPAITQLGATPRYLLSITQTNLSSNFDAAPGTAEQEVTGLRVTLPIYPGTCLVKAMLKVYWGTVTGSNNMRIRLGTSTSFASNPIRDTGYVEGAKTLDAYVMVIIVSSVDLSTQSYINVTVQNSVNANGMFLSASGARSTIVCEIYY